MRIGISNWDGRVSPVLDSSQTLLIVESNGERVAERRVVAMPDGAVPGRVSDIAALGIDVLICGAVSQPLGWAIESQGIALVPWVAGGVDEVLSAYLAGELSATRFSMPGCRGGGRRWRHAGPRECGPRRRRCG